MNQSVVRRCCLSLTSVSIAALFSACSLNPATGRPQLALMSEGQEVELGRKANQEIQATMPPYEDQRLQEYVSGLGHKLAAASERPSLPWTFTVVDDPAVNAFALPGGYIYITRGILNHMTSEAQVVGVLAHEIGHVTARHSVAQYSKAQLANIGMVAGMILAPELPGLGQLVQTGLQLMFLKFSRQDEEQADDLGLRYLTRAGYDSNEMVEMFRTLERTSEQEKGGRLPEWLSTHPRPGTRISRTTADIRAMPGAEQRRVGREEFMAHIDRLVFGEDPREGIFDNSTFYHPGMAFQFEMPSGWKTDNQKQGVIGLSPDKDAVVVLTTASGSSPAEAARTFFSKSGAQAGTTERASIHGLPAVSATFSVQQQEGTVRGMTAFIEHQGRIFQALGYTPAARFERYARVLAESITSLAPLRDPKYLNVKPKHIEIVKLSQPMSIEEFARRYPSNTDLRTLRIINQVEEGGQLVPGKSYKRVVGGAG